jgi:hypothetical protein
MCMISSVVRVVVGGGAWEMGGGGVAMVCCWCGTCVIWVDVGGCVCVLVCGGGCDVFRGVWDGRGGCGKWGLFGCWWWCGGRVHRGWWELG